MNTPTPDDLHAMLDIPFLWMQAAVDPAAVDPVAADPVVVDPVAADPVEKKHEPQSVKIIPFHGFVLDAAQEYHVDAALIRAIIMAESSNNPRAVSHKGAQGLMQLMPSTAKWLGVEDAFNPEMNIDAGVRYFRYLLDRFDGDVELALAAYNAGSRYVMKYKGVPPFKATRNYIKKVLNYYKHFSDEMAVNAEVNSSAV